MLLSHYLTRRGQHRSPKPQHLTEPWCKVDLSELARNDGSVLFFANRPRVMSCHAMRPDHGRHNASPGCLSKDAHMALVVLLLTVSHPQIQWPFLIERVRNDGSPVAFSPAQLKRGNRTVNTAEAILCQTW